MATDKKYSISIGNLKETIKDVTTLGEALGKTSGNMEELGKLTQKIENYDKEYQKAVQSSKNVLADKNKAIKEELDLEKAALTVQENSRKSYYEKQKVLTALGKQIKSMNTDTEEQKRKQQDLINEYASLNQELKDFDSQLGNHQRSVGDYEIATRDLRGELREMQLEMANMLAKGVDKLDPAFVELSKKAGVLKDAMGDARQEIDRYASDTKKLDDVINIAQSATAAFELYKGAMSAFGMETEEAEKAMQKLMGAMSIIQSLKTLQDTLSQNSATAKLLNGSLNMLSLGMKGTTKASKLLRIALMGIGIGLIIALVGTLIANWEDLVGWFKKTFPILNNLGAKLKGVGEAIKAFLIDPIGDFANVMKLVFSGKFGEALDAAKQALKKRLGDALNAYGKGYQEEMTRKATEESNKRTQQELKELKIQERNNKTYSKKYIALQKKDFAERKLLAKGNKEELDKIKLEEMEFFADVEDKKTDYAQKMADARAKNSQKAAEAAKKAAEEAAKKQKDEEEFRYKAEETYYRSMTEYLIAQKERVVEYYKAGVKLYEAGPIEKYTEEVNNLNRANKELLELQRQLKLYDFLDDYRSNIDATVTDLNVFMTAMNNIVKKSQEYGKEVSVDTFASFAKENKIFSNLTADQFKYLYSIYINYLKDGLKNTEEKQADIQHVMSNILKNEKDEIDKTVLQYEVGNILKLENTEQLIDKLKQQWDNYLIHVKKVYGEDSEEYLKAIKQRATEEGNITGNKRKKKKLWYGKDDKKDDGSSYSLIDNLANVFTELDEMVLAPAMDTFSMYMDFAIQETQQRLEEVENMHDKALEKVEASTERIAELNENLKDSSNDNKEATKQQLADEQLLYAQRLAEEQKLQEEETRLKNQAAEQDAKARKMELGYQMVMAMGNAAQGASKALAQWGWPLGPIFAGVMGALGAVQVALIARQISKIKPIKYAEGGTLSSGIVNGRSHSQGGVRLEGTNIEVEGGEMVVSKKNTSRYMDVLQKINRNDPSVRYLQGYSNKSYADTKIRKYANGGQLNFEMADENLRANQDTARLIGAIGDINMQPVVAVRDIWNVEDRLVKVRGLAGRSGH